ncbi:neural cell adhesion molecule 2-like isoform X3 [Palaemon carinicauda]|uniref:neural cell adhesion molecule 2-like isoform X3 n=1 Tax=Palaemon carinicauda TaxID=392227 RepID=UPI0035B5DE99
MRLSSRSLSHVHDGILLQFFATLLFVSAIFCTTQVVEEDDQNGMEESPLTVVQAVESGRVLLPCDVSAPDPTDDTILILFYQGPIGTPIYSIDGRNGPINRAPHWTDETTLGTRAYFDMASEPPGLVLQSVKKSDDNEYRCRVDFRSSPTRNVRIELDVIVPPKKIRILSEAELDVSGVIGPYPVGASVKLQCQVDSGRPRPSVAWFHEGSLLDDISEVRRGDVTSNTLTIPALTRNDLYKVLTCQASNSNLSVPVAATVTLDMSFPPLDTRILGSLDNLAEGERYELVCESSGSRPTATITWWKGGILMTDTRSQVFQEGNVSRSTLYLTPSLADHDVYIFCRAKNPMVPSAVMEDSRKLNVHYTPRLSLAAGLSLDMDDIKEGDDVYFECGINANPKVIKVQWYHNGEELVHNVTAGVIQSNQSLVLQRVNRRSSGQYTCSATNLHGHGKSNAVQLSVKFAPVCRPGQKIIYGGGKYEELNVTCNVEAHPEPNYFRWAFNSSSEVVDIPSSSFKVIGKGRSQASYTPRTHLDYGTLLCWANNEVGRQLTPCIFHVIHASAPDPVNNCTVDNVTSASASIRCQAGWDGGMEQTFMLRVSHARAQTRAYDKKKEAPRVLANTSTSPKPEFLLTGLEPGTEYVLTIMGVNKKGQSDAMRMAIVTLKDVAEKRTSPVSTTINLTPILAVLFGVLASILLMVIVIVIVVRSRHPRPCKPEVKILYDKSGSPATLPSRRNSDPIVGDDLNPDIIPVNDDHHFKELQQKHGTAKTGISCGGEGIAVEQHQGSPSQTSPLQTSSKKEYLQGHEGSFYINPGTLLRQKRNLRPSRKRQKGQGKSNSRESSLDLAMASTRF